MSKTRVKGKKLWSFCAHWHNMVVFDIKRIAKRFCTRIWHQNWDLVFPSGTWCQKNDPKLSIVAKIAKLFHVAYHLNRLGVLIMNFILSLNFVRILPGYYVKNLGQRGKFCLHWHNSVMMGIKKIAIRFCTRIWHQN